MSSVEPHIVLNLSPYKTAKGMWACLKQIYHRKNSAQLFQLEYEIAHYTRRQILVHANVKDDVTCVAQKIHEVNQRD